MTKREQILETATKLFLELGFGGTSMDLITRESKVSKATLYAYFASKDALFLASVNYNRQKQQIIYPQLPDLVANNAVELCNDIYNYLDASFDYFTNNAECDFVRLLIAELPKFPQLFSLYYDKQETHITSNLELYLTNYYKSKNLQYVEQSYRIACQIIDMVKGQTIWVKLIKNPKREIFLKNKKNTIDGIMNIVSLLIKSHNCTILYNMR